jgi:hypothetical protein
MFETKLVKLLLLVACMSCGLRLSAALDPLETSFSEEQDSDDVELAEALADPTTDVVGSAVVVISSRLNISAVHDIIAASSVNITHVNISAGLVRFDAEYSGIGKTENSTVTYRITGFRPFKKTGGLPVYIWMAGAGRSV